jgi:hypothetical protein
MDANSSNFGPRKRIFVAISSAAFDAIKATLPSGLLGFEREPRCILQMFNAAEQLGGHAKGWLFAGAMQEGLKQRSVLFHSR